MNCQERSRFLQQMFMSKRQTEIDNNADSGMTTVLKHLSQYTPSDQKVILIESVNDLTVLDPKGEFQLKCLFGGRKNGSIS
ncbi:MAG: hypothetical protein FH756_00340 [Firmicutes bacterium]|nr:hypothetical protein [Bacillota bacterium]